MKRKIAFISEHASPLAVLGGIDAGGQNLYVGKLAQNLSKMGYEIDIFTRWDDARLPQIVDYGKGVRVIHIKAGPVTFIPKEELFKFMDQFASNMLNFINTEKEIYKLIHANFWMSAYVAVKIKRKENIPFVVTFHALGRIRRSFYGSEDKFPDERFQIEELAIREAENIIAECPQDREDLINKYNADPQKVTMIPAGFDPNEFYPVDKLLSRMALNINPDEQVILQLGRMVERKGVDNVIRGLAVLRKKYKIAAKLLIVGGDSDSADSKKTPEIGRLKRIAKKETVDRHITFSGRRGRDILKYFYNAADVFVSTPWYEPFGITPIEAMACGTPVVGSDVGGIKYTVSDGRTGYLVKPDDPKDLAHKLFEILSNKKLANLFRENAVNKVNKLFSWEKISGQLSRLYEKILFKTEEVKGRSRELVIIESNFKSLQKVTEQSINLLRIPILDAAKAIAKSVGEGGKVLICGNGGSASDAQHFAGELVGHFQISRNTGFAFLSLNSDTAVLTALANDYSYDEVFSRQVEALGQRGDILVGISTSGNSKNINLAFAKAHKIGMVSIALLGKGGGDSKDICDISLIVPSDDTQRIQEIHTLLVHILSELVEKQLFSDTEMPREALAPKKIFESAIGELYGQRIPAFRKGIKK